MVWIPVVLISDSGELHAGQPERFEHQLTTSGAHLVPEALLPRPVAPFDKGVAEWKGNGEDDGTDGRPSMIAPFDGVLELLTGLGVARLGPLVDADLHVIFLDVDRVGAPFVAVRIPLAGRGRVDVDAVGLEVGADGGIGGDVERGTA